MLGVMTPLMRAAVGGEAEPKVAKGHGVWAGERASKARVGRETEWKSTSVCEEVEGFLFLQHWASDRSSVQFT